MLIAKAAFKGADVFAAAIRTFNLAVAEEVNLWQQVFAQQTQALVVVFAPIVAVGELEAVNVPFGRIKLAADEFARNFVRRADARAAAFAGMVEGLFVHL